jgi:hypothetical protein
MTHSENLAPRFFYWLPFWRMYGIAINCKVALANVQPVHRSEHLLVAQLF